MGAPLVYCEKVDCIYNEEEFCEADMINIDDGCECSSYEEREGEE